MAWHRSTVLKRLAKLVAVWLSTAAFSHPTPVDFNGEILRWDITDQSSPLLWSIEVDDQSQIKLYELMVTEAAKIWSGVSTSYLQLTPAISGETPNITIYFQESIAGGDSAAGYAEFDETGSDGPIHCSIHITAVEGLDWTATSKTVLHELGHCLGLGHSLVPESIMSYDLDKNSFSLALDDRAAITRLYPNGSSGQKLPPGCAVQGNSPVNSAPLGLLLVFICFPFIVLPAGRLRSFLLAPKS